jgi:tetratricopeptide (TPR) repeat protein
MHEFRVYFRFARFLIRLPITRIFHECKESDGRSLRHRLRDRCGGRQRESGRARLEEAIAAYREALKERTRERIPLDWAATQFNLGNALLELGRRESGTARLEEAIAAYREALKERTRERVPLDWAATQFNLGLALQDLGRRESGTARLEEAIATYREALKEWTPEADTRRHENAQKGLDSCLALVEQRRRT